MITTTVILAVLGILIGIWIFGFALRGRLYRSALDGNVGAAAILETDAIRPRVEIIDHVGGRPGWDRGGGPEWRGGRR